MPDDDPIRAPRGARALRPADTRESEPWHAFDAIAAPWWVTTLWLAFFVFAFTNLTVSLLRLG